MILEEDGANENNGDDESRMDGDESSRTMSPAGMTNCPNPKQMDRLNSQQI